MTEPRCKICGRQQPSLTAATSCPLAQCEHKVAARRRAIEEEREALARKRREEEERNRDLTDRVDLTAFMVTPEAHAAVDGFFDFSTATTDTCSSDAGGSDSCSTDTGTDFSGDGGDSGGGGCSGEW